MHDCNRSRTSDCVKNLPKIRPSVVVRSETLRQCARLEREHHLGAPDRAGPPRNFTGLLVATLQNSGNTLQLECQSYSTAQTYTQAEVNSLNVSQYATQADIDSSVAPSSLTTGGRDLGRDREPDQLLGSSPKRRGDARYHPVNGNAGGGALLPQAPLGANLILGNSATVQLTCGCYSKSESDGRYFSNTDYAPRLPLPRGQRQRRWGRHHSYGARQLHSENDPSVVAPGVSGSEPHPRQLRHAAADLRLLLTARVNRIHATPWRGRPPRIPCSSMTCGPTGATSSRCGAAAWASSSRLPTGPPWPTCPRASSVSRRQDGGQHADHGAHLRRQQPGRRHGIQADTVEPWSPCFRPISS